MVSKNSLRLSLIFLLIILSLVCFNYWQNNKEAKRIFLNKVTVKESVKEFSNEILNQGVDTSKIDFYYINIWNTSCIPCVKEMPYLDSLAGELNENVKCVFVTEQSDDKINSLLKRKEIVLQHFICVNDLESFVSGLCNQGKLMKHTYPLHIIINRKFYMQV